MCIVIVVERHVVFEFFFSSFWSHIIEHNIFKDNNRLTCIHNFAKEKTKTLTSSAKVSQFNDKFQVAYFKQLI